MKNNLYMNAVEAGSYYYYRAEGEVENLISVTGRMTYQSLVSQLKKQGLRVPTAQELYLAATTRWPAAKLHPAPEEVTA